MDKFIVERAPWKLAKDRSREAQNRLDETLYTAAEALRIVCVLVSPVLPHAAEAIWQQLGFAEPVVTMTFGSTRSGAASKRGQKIGEIAPVFPRLDAKPTIQKMQELEAVEKKRQAALIGKPAAADSSTSNGR